MVLRILFNLLLGYILSVFLAFLVMTMILSWYPLPRDWSFGLGVVAGAVSFTIIGMPAFLWLEDKRDF